MKREDFWARVDLAGNCWIWRGAQFSNGYGRVASRARQSLAHRVAYEFEVGPIPIGLELDHLCRTRLCVRPDHLEPVTHGENNRRAALAKPRPEQCPRGHNYDGRRACRECSNAAGRRYRATERYRATKRERRRAEARTA